MVGSVRRSTITYDGGGNNSIVEQTTDIINRVRHSIVRSRQERFLDEDLQAIDQIANQLHLTELINKDTLGKLISQGNSIERSYHLIDELEKDIKDIAEDLNEVNGNKCCGAWKNGTCFGLTYSKKKKHQRKQKSHHLTKSDQIPLQSFNQQRLSLTTERQEILDKTRALTEQRREHPQFVQILEQLNQTKTNEIEHREKQINQLRDDLLQNHSLTYGYIDQPDRLVTEINMAIQFNQINTHLDHLLQITDNMSNQIDKHNLFISKIQNKAMESGNLLTDYTLLGNHILGTSTTQNQTLPHSPTNDLTSLGISTGQKVLLDSIVQMSSEFYFFDQDSRRSHLGGVLRAKKNSKDYHQALQDQKNALSFENDEHLDEFPSRPKENNSSQIILPEILTKELDSILQTYEQHSNTDSSSSQRSKSPESDGENGDTDEENPNPDLSQLPKVSLPGSLIYQLHSTWSDLIQNTNYQYKIWRTKAAEYSWQQFLHRKRSPQSNPWKLDETTENKQTNRRRTSSRISITSISNLSHRQSISTTNPKLRSSRTFSRSSIFSASHLLQENLRLLKILNPNSAEHGNESIIKNGIHVEFRFSSQDQQIKQKIASFDVPKSNGNIDEDVVHLMQNHCKRLLAETKEKILETISNEKLPKMWFYEDNQFVRKKTNLFISDDLHRKQKSKFVLSIFRGEIPERFQFDCHFPENKHKCYIELSDGSAQIYYPSGRLAVLRLSSVNSTILFYDDSPKNSFLGLVNSHGNILLSNPNAYARFLTNHQKECAYLCDGKNGFIQKQFPTNSTNENLFQFQLNSSMQIEYENSSNIFFVFNHENQLFEYQLGKSLTTFQNVTSTILTTKKISSNVKRTSSILPNPMEKQHILKQNLTHLEELEIFKKRIKHICHSWLKQCRAVLGIMNINAYHLPDCPFQSTKIEKKPIPSHEHLVKSLERETVLRNEKTPSNPIADVIEQFVPHSDVGRAMKRRISEKKLLQKSFPMIK